MIVNKILLRGGSISCWHEMRTTEINRDLLRAAEDALAMLRQGVASVASPIPSGVEMTVALGLPSLGEKHRRRMQDDWQQHNPEADPAEYELIRRHVDEHLRRTEFYIEHEGRNYGYTLIPADCDEDDPGLFGAVAGSSLANNSIGRPRTEKEMDTRRDRHRAVVREMVALKPAYIVETLSADPPSVFGDHFAAAMLLSDASRAGKND